MQIQRERPDGRFPLCEFQVHTERFTKQAQVLGKPRGEVQCIVGLQLAQIYPIEDAELLLVHLQPLYGDATLPVELL